MDAPMNALEKRLLSEIKTLYSKRLISVVVFGSVGRGTQRCDSDLDLLVIADQLPRGRMKRMEEFSVIEHRIGPVLKSLREAGMTTDLSPVIKSPEEAERGSPLFLDMVEDARILIDRNGFFEKVLSRLRGRLKQLGAKRIWMGSAWYWDLKPDYKPGECFDL
jgi:predicted nucleotidyltransferase